MKHLFFGIISAYFLAHLIVFACNGGVIYGAEHNAGSDWATCGFKPAPPPGYTSDDALCICDDDECSWVFTRR